MAATSDLRLLQSLELSQPLHSAPLQPHTGSLEQGLGLLEALQQHHQHQQQQQHHQQLKEAEEARREPAQRPAMRPSLSSASLASMGSNTSSGSHEGRPCPPAAGGPKCSVFQAPVFMPARAAVPKGRAGGGAGSRRASATE